MSMESDSEREGEAPANPPASSKTPESEPSAAEPPEAESAEAAHAPAPPESQRPESQRQPDDPRDGRVLPARIPTERRKPSVPEWHQEPADEPEPPYSQPQPGAPSSIGSSSSPEMFMRPDDWDTDARPGRRQPGLEDTQAKTLVTSFRSWIRDFFAEPPQVLTAFVVLGAFAVALFTRNPLRTNFIFDEQEALLANPYVRSVADASPKFGWLDAFRRDFWGLPADRSIGSYRPIPNLAWRLLWAIGARNNPLLHHLLFNVLFHAFCGALLVVVMYRWSRDRVAAWLTGAAFVSCAVLTEAVSGVVGIADVFGALGLVLAIVALALPLWAMPFAVFGAVSFGLYSKESALCAVPIVPLAALLTARYDHRDRPLAPVRGLVAFVASLGAFIAYVEARRRLFHVTLPQALSVEANAGKPVGARTFAALLRWYAQPVLPKDPINNPLAEADAPLRIAGALRVYWRGLLQIIVPYPLSGDYSAPQEPIPARPVFLESILGAAAMVIPLLAAAGLSIAAFLRRRTAMIRGWELDERFPDLRPIIALALVWVVASYLPVSNIPVVLPTVRAERFWYFPALATGMLLGLFLAWLPRKLARYNLVPVGIAIASLFLGMHALAARLHANDYADDLAFWNATRKAAPRSAKAHLNYSVMLGARHDLEGRLVSNRVALGLAPSWPMANVYLGDTLCRLHRPLEGWPHYARGFELAPNDVNLIALGLQCLWDEKALNPDAEMRNDLDQLGEKHPGTWLAYLARDILDNGEAHKGVDPKYRPRGYNEGPKE
jgi:hypothetical protein